MKINPLPPLEVLNTLLNYDPETGVFRWKQLLRRNQISEDSIAGSLKENGYIVITISNKQYPAHRLAYKMYYGIEPHGMLDHIDLNKSNNRINNLRIATIAQNHANTKARITNRTGVKGVSLRSHGYIARFRFNKKEIHLGTYKTIKEASLAYEQATKKYFGEFARTS
jgi:hypothetical protein